VQRTTRMVSNAARAVRRGLLLKPPSTIFRPIGIGGLCLIAALGINAAISKQRQIRDGLKTQSQEIRQLSAQVSEVTKTVSKIGSMPLSLGETPEGISYVPANLGLSMDELDFLKRFRGPVLDLKTESKVLQSGNLKSILRGELIAAFSKDLRNLELGATPRSALIAFAVLRVNGSIPTYEVRDSVPNDIRSMILGTSGNCSDFTIRTMMIGEALGLKVALISANTPAFPGHVFVDAYDHEEDTAYLLDANFNVVVSRTNAGGRGFMELMFSARVNAGEDLTVTAHPVYFRYLDPGPKALFGTPLSLDMWVQTPSNQPRTLAEFRAYLSDIPAEFDRSGDYAARIRNYSKSTELVIKAR
jgi:hypothetical protein